MRRVTSMLLVASTLLAGAAGLYVSQAPAQFASSPFGSGPSGAAASGGDGGVPCGVNDTCAALGYEATTTADGGVGFACDASLPSCVRLGANACNRLGEDPVTGYATFGAGCAPVLEVGDGKTRIQSGVIAVTGGGIFARSSYIQNDGTGFGGAVAIEDLQGLSINLQTLGGAPITFHAQATATLNFGTILASSTATLTATVTGIALGDSVTVTQCPTLEADVGDLRAWVSAADTVTLSVRNLGALAVDPAACAFSFRVMR